jgi:uroporphyrin-3 C-methyltransferase
LNDDKKMVEADPVDRLLRDKKPSSSGKGIAILALLVALAAVTDSAWRWWQEYRSNESGVTLQESLQQVKSIQTQMSQSLTDMQSRVADVASQVKTDELDAQAEQLAGLERKVTQLTGQSDEEQAAIAALQGSIRSEELRIATVEAGLINVAASSRNSSKDLELAEIDFLLRAASERLQLFADPNAADLALQAADLQLEALEDPMYLSVRQRIASSRQELASVPNVDFVAVSATLDAMQQKVAGLPFKGMAAPAPKAELPADSGWWASLKSSLSSLVTVRRRVPQDNDLLSLEDKDYLRQGLWLQLESARLSLMRNDAEAFEVSLQRVNQTVKRYFENGAESVQSMLQDIASLQLVEVSPAMPDISAPWSQLRQLRDSRKLLKDTPPLNAPPPQTEQQNTPEVEESDLQDMEAQSEASDK